MAYSLVCEHMTQHKEDRVESNSGERSPGGNRSYSNKMHLHKGDMKIKKKKL